MIDSWFVVILVWIGIMENVSESRKKMGKEMEEADHQWTCPKCKTKEEKQNTAQLKDKLKERQTKVITKENITAAGNNDKNTTSKPQKPNKSMRRSLSKDKETNEPKKVKFLNK